MPPLFRLPVEPNENNGLPSVCRLMVDRIKTVPKAKIGSRVGRLNDEDVVRLNRAVAKQRLTTVSTSGSRTLFHFPHCHPKQPQ